ncbi:hypothetical protein JTE90_018558 [Oedothorax gibbosus]|uniref:Matrix extracellular phosphoglycoprotein n=1 Tax=Oedothorax gibbosus TaxID=931172 RepID=A0AAV6U4S5_9ARAC|nr:hypothetical protein JTE90_018558 [Oedothorax gibbosus]
MLKQILFFMCLLELSGYFIVSTNESIGGKYLQRAGHLHNKNSTSMSTVDSEDYEEMIFNTTDPAQVAESGLLHAVKNLFSRKQQTETPNTELEGIEIPKNALEHEFNSSNLKNHLPKHQNIQKPKSHHQHGKAMTSPSRYNPSLGNHKASYPSNQGSKGKINHRVEQKFPEFNQKGNNTKRIQGTSLNKQKGPHSQHIQGTSVLKQHGQIFKQQTESSTTESEGLEIPQDVLDQEFNLDNFLNPTYRGSHVFLKYKHQQGSNRQRKQGKSTLNQLGPHSHQNKGTNFLESRPLGTQNNRKHHKIRAVANGMRPYILGNHGKRIWDSRRARETSGLKHNPVVERELNRTESRYRRREKYTH